MAALTTTTPGTAPAVIDLKRPNRRQLLGEAIAGLAGAMVLAGGGVAIATPETLVNQPDAELIDACDRYVAALRINEREGGHLDNDVCPFWQAAEAHYHRINATETRSFTGIVALARVAHYWAHMALDGTEDFADEAAAMWTARIVRDVLRIGGLA